MFVRPFGFTFTVLLFQSVLAAVRHETDVVLRDGVRPGPRHVEATGHGAGRSANRQSGARGAEARAQEGKLPSSSQLEF